jgi:DNA-binding NarL/FixJ family response regulator
VMDADVHAGGGVKAVKGILSASPSIRIVVFTSELHAKQRAEFLEAGAKVCISRSEPIETVVEGIRSTERT